MGPAFSIAFNCIALRLKRKKDGQEDTNLLCKGENLSLINASKLCIYFQILFIQGLWRETRGHELLLYFFCMHLSNHKLLKSPHFSEGRGRKQLSSIQAPCWPRELHKPLLSAFHEQQSPRMPWGKSLPAGSSQSSGERSRPQTTVTSRYSLDKEAYEKC